MKAPQRQRAAAAPPRLRPGTPPGGDFAPAVSASQLVSGSTGTATFTGAGLVADVQAWVNNPATNFGWIMVAQNESAAAVRFTSREGANAPSLVVDFTAPTGGSSRAPTVTTQPTSQSVAAGAVATLTIAAAGTPTFQWRQNGTVIAGATSASLAVSNAQPANAGLYSAIVTNGSGSASSTATILGVTSTVKLVGLGQEFPDIVGPPPNLFIYDQILLGGAAATVKADANQILRISFIDLNDDIVQV
ncbi:MAG: hypothetical protein EXS38_11430 [Opitutus sp.]|nr:hypothetical protein [Opitutus sp.]